MTAAAHVDAAVGVRMHLGREEEEVAGGLGAYVRGRNLGNDRGVRRRRHGSGEESRECMHRLAERGEDWAGDRARWRRVTVETAVPPQTSVDKTRAASRAIVSVLGATPATFPPSASIVVTHQEYETWPQYDRIASSWTRTFTKRTTK
jgi:hypothetical protein